MAAEDVEEDLFGVDAAAGSEVVVRSILLVPFISSSVTRDERLSRTVLLGGVGGVTDVFWKIKNFLNTCVGEFYLCV